MSSPASSTWPESGSTRPATMRSTVLFPQPDGPSSERNSPGAASSETSSTATTGPNVLRSRRRLSAGAALVTGGGAIGPRSASARDLAPPALRPLGELLRHQIRVGEVHAPDDVAVRHELGEVRRQLDGLVARAGELRLGEAELAFGRQQRADVFLRELALLAGLRHGDRRDDADRAFLRVRGRDRHALRGGGTRAVRIPDGDGDVSALEQRNDLVRLRVHHLHVRLELLDRLEAGIDVLDGAAVEPRRRHQELLSRRARDIGDGELALVDGTPEVGPR